MNAPAPPQEQGIALLRAGRFEEAAQQFAMAMRQLPLAPEPRAGLAQAVLGAGDGYAATAWLADACRIAPQREDLWHELGRVLAQQGRDAEIAPMLQLALALHPNSRILLAMEGELALRRRQYPKALATYQKLRDLFPADSGFALNLGFAMEQVGQLDRAVAMYRAALAIKPDFVEAHIDLAGVLWRVQDFEGTLVHAQRAIEIAPAHPYAVRIMGTALLNLNRVSEAQAYLRKALELQPGFSLAELDLAFALLLAGQLEEGWKWYALRWRDTDRMHRPAFYNPQLEWKGLTEQPLAGKAIAIYAEQGLGDVIQFVRYAKQLQASGARVCAVVQDSLVALIEHSFPGVTCLRPGVTLQVQGHVALMDLPMHFGTTKENIPAEVPYLFAPDAKVAEWAQRMGPPDGRLRVGIAWCGSMAQVNNNNRAMRLSDLVPIMNMDGVQCFSLQKSEVGPFTDVAPSASQLVDLTPEWGDFTDTAGVIANLDLVITVDTSIAHLAGAMGKPVWVMLPPNADWRYLLDRDDSPWYPTMRLFRREFKETRAAQVERVVRALASLNCPPR